MGIRLYVRNRDYPENELCLGKLFGYVDDAEKLKCVEYLDSIGAIGSNFLDWKENYPDCKTLIDAFIDACAHYSRFGYGEFFQLSTAQCIKFIYLYREDQKRILHNSNMMIDEMEIDFLTENESKNNVWEFRLL